MRRGGCRSTHAFDGVATCSDVRPFGYDVPEAARPLATEQRLAGFYAEFAAVTASAMAVSAAAHVEEPSEAVLRRCTCKKVYAASVGTESFAGKSD